MLTEVGIQSLNDEILEACGRSHSASEAIQALEVLSNLAFRCNTGLGANLFRNRYRVLL